MDKDQIIKDKIIKEIDKILSENDLDFWNKYNAVGGVLNYLTNIQFDMECESTERGKNKS